jgi:outer membrane protein insertion porin family
MRSLSAAALILLGALGSAAQNAGPAKTTKKEPPPGIIHAITVKGNHLYPTAGIVRESGLKPGDRATAASIEAARTKLLATELFNNVSDQYRFSAGNPPEYDVAFEVVENEQRFPMRFERLGVPPETIRQYLEEHVPLFSERIPGTQGVLNRYAAAVQELVAKTNPAIKVKAQVSNDDPKELTVVFTTNAPAPTISQVQVSGNQAIDTGTILRAVNLVAVGVPLSDARLQMILDKAIKPLYAAKGYAAVTFPKIETEPSASNLGVVVKVNIKEGPLFKFGSIRFRGNGMDQEEIRSNIPFKPGQTFNGDQVENFRIDLIHRMKRRGLLDANITTETEADDTQRAVNIVYNVTPGAVYSFQKLDIRGLDINTEPAIAKLWGEKPGAPFNPDYPEFFLKRVKEQGILDNLAEAKSDYSADQSTHNVTVYLKFKGGEPKNEDERKKQEEERRRDGRG